MTNVTWVAKEELMRRARQRFLETDVLLDIGCGIMPQTALVPCVHICVEPFQEYVDVLQKKNATSTDRSYVILRNTWDEALKILPRKSVDTVMLADVIEHLDKGAAVELLMQTEALARQQILIFTPLGFLPQTHPDGQDAWGLGGGDWQEHKSGWTPEDFGEGWEIMGSKEYYFEDNLGRPFSKPFGAFWAIKTFDTSHDHRRLERRRLSSRFATVASRFEHSLAAKQALVWLDLLAWGRNMGSRLYRTIRPRSRNPS